MTARSRTSRTFWIGIAVIAAVGLCIRLVFIFTVSHHETAFYDAFYYRLVAEQFSRGHGFTSVSIFSTPQPDAAHPPLTVLALAPVARLFGSADLPMRFTMTAVGLGTLVVVGVITRRIAGVRAGLIAAGLVAVYPNFWMPDGLIMSEALSALTTALTILAIYKLIAIPSLRNAALAGVACGFALLARAELVLFVPFVIAPAIVMMHERWQRRLGLLVIAVAMTGIVVAPWVVYNERRFDRPVFMSTGDGDAFLGANCDQTYYGSDTGGWSFDCTLAVPKVAGDASVIAAKHRQFAFDYMSHHKSRFPLVALARLGREFSVYHPVAIARRGPGEGRPASWSLVGLGMFYVLVGFAVAGVVVLRRRRVPLLPLIGVVAAVCVTAVVVRGEIRFRVPAEVVIVILAAVAADALITGSRSHSERPAPTPGSAGRSGAPPTIEGRRGGLACS